MATLTVFATGDCGRDVLNGSILVPAIE